jgi:hypothetical protein
LNKIRFTGARRHKGGIHYDLIVNLALLGFEDEAIQNSDSPFKYESRWDNLYENDLAFRKIKSLPGFHAVQKKVNDYNGFMKMTFTNGTQPTQPVKS